jgi:hypothetical protein
MKKVLALALAICMSGAALNGCANIKDDGARTKTEGTLVGAGVGAAAGAGIGAAIGGRGGALLGGLIGAAAGAIGGYAYGSHVANKKAEYASEEEWLDACIKSAEENNQALREHNRKVVAEIGSLEKQTARLEKAYAAKTAGKAVLTAEKEEIDQKIKKNAEWIAAAETEISEQSKVVAEARSSGQNDYAATLQKEIDSLKRQKSQLEDSNKKLTAMSSRLSV